MLAMSPLYHSGFGIWPVWVWLHLVTQGYTSAYSFIDFNTFNWFLPYECVQVYFFVAKACVVLEINNKFNSPRMTSSMSFRRQSDGAYSLTLINLFIDPGLHNFLILPLLSITFVQESSRRFFDEVGWWDNRGWGWTRKVNIFTW